MAEEKQDGQKTLVAFVVGLLIGGMLVWAFSGPNVDAPDSDDEINSGEVTDKDDDKEVDTDKKDDVKKDEEKVVEKQVLEVGEGEVKVNDQKASSAIKLESATYPVSEGWIGVRQYTNEQLGYILGVVRFSESQGIVPDKIILQNSTTPGREYAVVIFTEDGDLSFNLAGDVQIDQIFDTFKAE